jgi:MFS family permease
VAVTDQPERANIDHAHNVRAVLAGRGFRRLLGVRLVSQVADGWFQAGLGGSIFFAPEKHTNAVAIAVGFAVLLLPYSLIGPYVGVFLDRWSRRTALYVTNALRGLLVPAVVLIIWTGSADRPWLTTCLVVVALVIIGLDRFFLAGVSASIPHVVADDRLVTANALSGTLGSVAFSLGLGSTVLLVNVAGVPANRHGYAALSALATIGYLASALLARVSFRREALGPDAAERRRGSILAGMVEVGSGMVAGVRHLVSKRVAAYAMAAQASFRFLYGVLALATVLLYRNYFNSDTDVSGSIGGLGLVFAAGGLGVLVAAFVTPPMTRRIGGWRWIAWLLGAVGVVVPALALPFIQLLLVASVFFVNIAAQSIKIVVDTALQHECADEYRGRVFSVNDTTFNLCFVAGLFVCAKSLPGDGRSAVAVVLIGLGYLGVAVWYGVASARLARRSGKQAGDPEAAGLSSASV